MWWRRKFRKQRELTVRAKGRLTTYGNNILLTGWLGGCERVMVEGGGRCDTYFPSTEGTSEIDGLMNHTEDEKQT